jgi:hypothetical protein
VTIVIVEYIDALEGGKMFGASTLEVSLPLAAICIIIPFIFRRRIKRRISEATH